MKRSESRVEVLIKAFKTNITLSKFVIETMFPTASATELIWQIRNRRGMCIEQEKVGKNIIYHYRPDIAAPIIKGSKKKYKLNMMLNREVY